MTLSKSRFQLDAEVMTIIKNRDIRVMNRIIWERFKKPTIAKLTNEQVEILIPLIKEEYEIRSKRLSSKQQSDDPQ